MATGYTKALETISYNVPLWLKQHVIRAMGVAIVLRDEPSDLSAEEVGKRITAESQDSINRALKSVEASKRQISELLERPDAEWRVIFEVSRTKAEADLNQRLETWNRDKKEHQRALKECEALYTKALETRPEKSVEVGTLKFAVSQLRETIDWDFKSLPYSDSVLTTPFKTWKKAQIESAKRGLELNEESYQKAKTRETDRAKGYLDFIRFIDQNTEKQDA